MIELLEMQINKNNAFWKRQVLSLWVCIPPLLLVLFGFGYFALSIFCLSGMAFFYFSCVSNIGFQQLKTTQAVTSVFTLISSYCGRRISIIS